MRAKGGSGGVPPRAMAEDEYFDTAEVAVDRGSKDGARDRAATRATSTADDDIIVMVGLLFLLCVAPGTGDGEFGGGHLEGSSASPPKH